jgi:hypothetical protein
MVGREVFRYSARVYVFLFVVVIYPGDEDVFHIVDLARSGV